VPLNDVKPTIQTAEPTPTQKIAEPKLNIPLALLKQALNCVGLIMVRNKTDESAVPRGSAVIIAKDGIIATNYHVVREDNQDRLFDEITFSLPEVGMPATAASAKRFLVQVVQKSKDNDLALLRIIADQAGKPLDKNVEFQSIELGDSNKVELMDNLVIIGFPATGGLTVTTNAGIVQGKDLIENWIKTDARLLHGNSGGAAIDDKGRLIGIPTKVEVDRPLLKMTSPRNYSKDIEQVYAIGYLRPANLVTKMLETLRYIESKPTALTSGTGSNTANEAPRDIIVKGILKSSPDGTLIAGAIVGLVSADSEEITKENIISWGRTNGEGKFELNPPVAAGKYKLRVKATGLPVVTREIEITSKSEPIIIELKKTQAN
jgi:S1-C subfamily serine protease